MEIQFRKEIIAGRQVELKSSSGASTLSNHMSTLKWWNIFASLQSLFKHISRTIMSGNVKF